MGRPTFLLLDEPDTGLGLLMAQKIFEVIRNILCCGVTILLVEQNAKLFLKVANHAYVLDRGRISLVGMADELLNNPQVRHACPVK